MRQLSLRSLLGCGEDKVVRARKGTLEVWDLFCGAGGFSTGAVAAGCHVAFACDSCEEAIKTHKRNHPSTFHRVCELPCELPLPTDGRSFHLHGSPPCQLFSTVNHKLREDGDKEHGINLVEWYITYALASRATSWSMEQVAAREVIEIVKRMRCKHRDRVSYAIFRFNKLGVPQTRRRLIAGSPHLIAKLLREEEQQNERSIRSVIAKPRGTHVRGGTSAGGLHTPKDRIPKVGADGNVVWVYKRAAWNEYCVPLDGLAPTVIGRHALVWITGNGEGCNRSVLYPSELAALQTFPPGYKLPTNKYHAYLQVGNAVPPRVAELMMRGECEPLAPLSPSLRRPPGGIEV